MRRSAPRPGSCHRRSKSGFTLVELLAVISIIMLLIALLMPSLRKARRKAIILASQIAYVGIDGRVYVVPHSGGVGVDVAQVRPYEGFSYRSHVQWSPCGQKIGVSSKDNTVMRPEGYPTMTATYVIEPMSGTVLRHWEDREGAFRTWLDSNRYLCTSTLAVSGEWNRGVLVRDAGSGAVLGKVPSVPIRFQKVFLSRLPPSVHRYHYVGFAIEQEKPPGLLTVRLWTKDLRPGKVIWTDTLGVYSPFPSPAVDPSGQWVAWTHNTVANGGRGVAIKAIDAEAAVEPTVIGADYEFCYFCDWTEQGTILVNVSEPPRRGSYLDVKWGLKILDRKGRLVREIHTEVPPDPQAIASWRKHLHY